MKTYRIIIHCSATAADATYTELDIKRDHMARGIHAPGGYHWYVRKDGRKVPMRTYMQQGAHATPYNADSWGICYEGGLKAGGSHWRDAVDTRTEAQKASLLDCIYDTIEYIKQTAKGEIKKDYVIEIIGHGQLPGVAKECPSYDAKKEYEWITA